MLTTLRFGSDPQLTVASKNTPPLRRGAKGEGVAILQQALIDLGFEMPASTAGGKKLPDGIYGAETNKTVLNFQKKNGLQPDGVVGRQTLQKLEQILISNARLENARLVTNMQGPPSRREISSV
jgi:peptidoglycan hydrolase-like protein with peptidoglycan-binding domain